MKKRQEKKMSVLKANTPSSSDVSDTDNDEEIGANLDQALKFLNIVTNSFGLNKVDDSTLKSYLGSSSNVNINHIEKALDKIMPEKTYSTSNIHKITSLMHAPFGKVPLKPKESFNILLSSKIMPDVETVDKTEAAFAVSRSFKYIILRNS
jgi:hypothetical protein